MADIKCIDVSTWQGDIDWSKVKKSGISHAILRAGYGKHASQIDEKFLNNYANAKKQGIKIGVYWYSYASDKSNSIKEAQACLEVLKGKTLDMPVFYDMEESSMTKLGKSTLTTIAKAFCDTIIKGGFRAGVYSNPNWFRNYLDYEGLKKIYPIWLAQYYTSPSFECDMWQYSSEGSVSGISGNVDMNKIFNSSIIKSESDVSNNDTDFETALLQALLRQAYAQGLCKTFVKPIDNKYGKLTKSAVVECRTSLGYRNVDDSIDLDFIKELEHEINVIRIAKENVLKAELDSIVIGDFNRDGTVDIKDATAIQKNIAGIEE